MKRSPSHYITTPERDKIPQTKQKSVSAYCCIVYSSSIAVDTKVTNASLTQNQSLQCVMPFTELNNDSVIKFLGVHY